MEEGFIITREQFYNEEIQKKLRNSFQFSEKPNEIFEKNLEDDKTYISFEKVVSYFLKKK